MIAPRRFLPSISSLLALEAVERLGSATAAATELSLTQSAVSRQLQVVEEQIGVQILVRDGKKLQLTPAGREYVAEVRKLLHGLAAASLKLKANPSGGVLNLAILPAFGMHWLAPRLKEFALAHPEVTVQLSTRMKPFDFASEPFDAAIHFGREDWPGVSYLPLMTEEVVPVAAPGLLAEVVDQPDHLLTLPLLHLETRKLAWRRWFEAQGCDQPVPAGMMFDQFSTMAQAAIHGLGIALLPSYLVEADIEAGRLEVVFGGAVRSVGAYYLVCPSDAVMQQPLAAFRRWLERAAAASDTA